MKDGFRKIANKVSNWTGSASAFLLALGIVVVWAITGPTFHYSSTWQLVINTGTTIITFLMVFLIQNTQNRDGKAMQLKLDELIHSSKSARDALVDLEDLTDAEISELDEEFRTLHEAHASHPSPVMHKLHTKIEAEKHRRISLSDAGHMLNKFNPLSNHDENKS
jgi:low affinity Fe/Cu permease